MRPTASLAHAPLAPTRRRDAAAGHRRDQPRGPCLRSRSFARVGGRVPRVPPPALSGHAAPPAARRGPPTPRCGLVPRPPLGPRAEPRLGGDRAQQYDRGGRRLDRLPRALRRAQDHHPWLRGRARAVSAADGIRRRRALLRALRAPPPEPVPHAEGDLPRPPPRRPPGPHHAEPPPRRDALPALARLGGPAAHEPPVSRAVPVPPVSPAQSRVHGQRARLLPRAAGEGPLRLPPRSRVLLRRARRGARDPRRLRAASQRGRETARPDAPRPLPEPPRSADGARVADRRRAGRVGRARPGRGIRAGGGGRARHPGLHPAAHVSVPPDGRARGLRRAAPAGDGPRAPLAHGGPPRWRASARDRVEPGRRARADPRARARARDRSVSTCSSRRLSRRATPCASA